MLNARRIQGLLTIILIAIALVLGYAIYSQRIANQPKLTPERSLSPSPKLLPSELTEQEKTLLNPPSSDAPQEERDKHDALAAKLSKESDSLDITDCHSNPLVVRAKINQDLTLKNKEDIDRKLIFDADHQYSIPKNSTTTIKVDFGKGPGLYGYVCEGVGLTGFILVTP